MENRRGQKINVKTRRRTATERIEARKAREAAELARRARIRATLEAVRADPDIDPTEAWLAAGIRPAEARRLQR